MRRGSYSKTVPSTATVHAPCSSVRVGVRVKVRVRVIGLEG